MKSEIDTESFQQMFSPKRKRLISHSTSKKSNAYQSQSVQTSSTTIKQYKTGKGDADENNKNGANSLFTNSPKSNLVGHRLSTGSFLNNTDSEFQSEEGSSIMSLFQSPPGSKRTTHNFASSGEIKNLNNSSNNSNVFTDLDFSNGFGEEQNTNTDYNIYSSGKRGVRSAGSSVFGSADRGDNGHCDLWRSASPPRSVCGIYSRESSPNQDDSIERLHSSYLADLSSPISLRLPSVAPLSVHSSGGSSANRSRRMLFASGGTHRRGASSGGEHSDSSASSVDIVSPVLANLPPPKTVFRRSGDAQCSISGPETSSPLADPLCMAGRMSSLSVTRRGSKHGRGPFDDDDLCQGDDMPPPQKQHLHHQPLSPVGFGKALFRDESIAAGMSKDIFSSTPVISRHRGTSQHSALFAGGVDLGTPLTERGSPAVLHDMDYEHAGDDEDEDGRFGDDDTDRCGAMRIFGASPMCDSSLSQGTQSALQHYGMFAHRVMADGRQQTVGQPDFHRNVHLSHDVGLPPFSSHKRLDEERHCADRSATNDTTLEHSHDQASISNCQHVTQDLMNTSTSSTQLTAESSSNNSSLLMDTSATFSAGEGVDGQPSGGMLTGAGVFSAFTRTSKQLHRRVNSRGLGSLNSSNNSSCTNMSLSLDQSGSVASSRNASTATEVAAFRPLPDQSAFDLTLSHSVNYSDNLGTFSGASSDGGHRRKCSSSPLEGSSLAAAALGDMCSPGPSSPHRSAAWSVDSVTEQRLSREQEAARSKQEQHQLFYGLGSSSSSSLDLHHFPPPPVFKMTRQTSLVDNKLLLAQDDDEETDTLGNTLDVFSTESHHQPHGDICFARDFVNEGLLGSGTFADVFKVTQRNSTDTTHYAVKKSRRQFQSKRDREWLLNEVRTMKLLGDSHHHRPCPYIIQFVRAWQEDSFFYVQIGLAEKGTLRDLMNDLMHANQTLPDETLFRITHDVSAGLRHIHECGMIHLDIKPANLLITQGGLIQIGDFGMATYKGSRDDGHEGDTRYMAHELLNETERMPSADIFSLGLTLYELSYSKQRLETGCISLPFDGPMWHALRQGRADVVTDRPAVLVEVIERAMAPLPRDRPSAAQILQVAEVIAARDRADETLLLAKPIATQNQSALNRSSSFNPAFMSSLSIHTALTALPPDEYAALMERAFTPH